MEKVRFNTLRKLIPDKALYAFGKYYSTTNLPKSGTRHEGFVAMWEEWVQSEFYDQQKLEELQWERFKSILDFAYERVSYYKNKYDEAGVKPSDIQSYSDLVKLPIIEKSELRENNDAFLPDRPEGKGWGWMQTTGSTGSPTRVYMDLQNRNAFRCVVRRYQSLAGVSLGDPCLMMLRRSFSSDKAAKEYRGVYVPWTNLYAIASTNLIPDVMKIYIKKAMKFKPSFIEGYSSAVYALACYILDNNISFPVKSIITRTDHLYPKYQETISKAFQTDDIYNFYGNVEGVASGCDCNLHNGKHTNMEFQLIETLNDKDQQVFDKPGTVVGTNLLNRGMPLIRYRLGDRVTLSKKVCGCGRGSYMINSIEGRMDDLLHLPDGRTMSTGSLWLTVESGINGYQIVQKAPDHLVLNVNLSKNGDASDGEKLIEALKTHVGLSVNIDINYTDKIPLVNGKFKFIVNEM